MTVQGYRSDTTGQFSDGRGAPLTDTPRPAKGDQPRNEGFKKTESKPLYTETGRRITSLAGYVFEASTP